MPETRCAMTDEKLIEKISLCLGPTMFSDLSRVAARDDRSVGEYVRHVLAVHLYGQCRVSQGDSERAGS